MFNKIDLKRNRWMLTGRFRRRGYDWWWHNFTATDALTGEEVPFFVEFFTINPKDGQDKVVLGQEHPETRTRPHYLMVKAGCWGRHKVQLHRFYAFRDVTIGYDRKTGYFVKAPEAYASETSLKGHIQVREEQAKNPGYMCDAGEIAFDLRLDKKIAFNVGYGASGLFRFLKAFEMYWHAQGIKTLVEGKIILNGREYLVRPETSYGYSDKNWGCAFTSPWVWLASSDIYSRKEGRKLDDSAFDIGGGRPVVFHVPLDRKLLGVFYLEGNEKPEFNFSKFWMGVRTAFSKDEDEKTVYWHVVQSNHHYRMETEIQCRKEDMISVNYEDPDGDKKFRRLYNGGNGKGVVKLYGKKGRKRTLVDTYDVGHVGCEYGEFEKK